MNIYLLLSVIVIMITMITGRYLLLRSYSKLKKGDKEKLLVGIEKRSMLSIALLIVLLFCFWTAVYLWPERQTDITAICGGGLFFILIVRSLLIIKNMRTINISEAYINDYLRSVYIYSFGALLAGSIFLYDRFN